MVTHLGYFASQRYAIIFVEREISVFIYLSLSRLSLTPVWDIEYLCSYSLCYVSSYFRFPLDLFMHHLTPARDRFKFRSGVARESRSRRLKGSFSLSETWDYHRARTTPAHFVTFWFSFSDQSYSPTRSRPRILHSSFVEVIRARETDFVLVALAKLRYINDKYE